MFTKLRNTANRPVSIGSNSFPLWQVASVSTAALFITLKAYQRLTRPKYSSSTTAQEIMTGKDLSGRTIIVTGANTGLGKETSYYLVKAGARVIMACRSEKKANIARNSIISSFSSDKQNEIKSRLIFMKLDLNDFDSIYSFVKQYNDTYDRLDILLNNAGIMALPQFSTTKQGFEKQFGVNHMGHSYLTLLLTPLLKKSKYNGRVVMLSSSAHRYTNFNEDFETIIKSDKGPIEDDYKDFHNYGISKTSNMIFAYEYNKRHYQQYNLSAVSVHPGVIATELSRDVPFHKFVPLLVLAPFILKSTSQGISTSLRACTLSQEEIKQYNGEFFADCQPWTENKKLRKPLIPLPGGNRLKPDHDPLLNDKFDDICKQFYDWTLQKIKETGAEMEI